MNKLTIILTVLICVAAHGEIRQDDQVRLVSSYGIAYTSMHLYREQIGLSRPLSWLLTGLTVGAASLAYDKLSGVHNGRYVRNLGISSVGYLGAGFTFSLFEADKPIPRIKKQEQKPSAPVTVENNCNVNVATKETQPNVVVIDKTKHLANTENKTRKRESKVFYYQAPTGN